MCFPFPSNVPECTLGVNALGGKASFYDEVHVIQGGFSFPVTVLNGVLNPQGHPPYSLQSLLYASPQYLFTSTNPSFPSYVYLLCAELKGLPTELYRSYSLLSTYCVPDPVLPALCASSHLLHTYVHETGTSITVPILQMRT